MHNRLLLNASHASGDDFAKVKLLQTLNPDVLAALILNDQVHLVLLFGSEVRDAQPLIRPIEIKKSDSSCKPSLSARHRGRA